LLFALSFRARRLILIHEYIKNKELLYGIPGVLKPATIHPS